MGLFSGGKAEANESGTESVSELGQAEQTTEPKPSEFVRDIVNSAAAAPAPTRVPAPSVSAAAPDMPTRVPAPSVSVPLAAPTPWDPRSIDLYTHPHGDVEPEPEPVAVAQPTQEFVSSLAIANGMGASAVGRPKRIGAFGIAVMVLAVAIIGFGTYIFLRKITDNFSIFGNSSLTAVAGEVGSPTAMPFGGHTFEITVTQPLSQPSAAWASFLKPTSGRYLLLSVALTRTDNEPGPAQVASYDWKFSGSDGQTVSGSQLAGGYGPLLSTVDLQDKDTKTGIVAFDTDAIEGTLSLTSPMGTWGTWPVTATEFIPAEGVLGEGLLPQPGSPPFSVTVANPRWLAAGDPAVSIAPTSGNFLVIDLVAAVDPERVAPGTSLYVSDKNFRFISASRQPVPANSGRVVGSNPITFGANAGQIGQTVIAFDVSPGAGVLEFLNADGSVLARWNIPGA